MVDLLNRFKADLENASNNKITDEILNRSIGIFNRIRQSLSRIYSLQSEYPGIIRGSDLYALIRGTMVMDRETAADCRFGQLGFPGQCINFRRKFYPAFSFNQRRPNFSDRLSGQ